MNNDINANLLETGNDETERLALEECVKRQRFDQRVSVLVIPAGRCELGVKFARLGAQVIVADNTSRQSEVEGRILASDYRDSITYLGASIGSFPDNAPGEPYDPPYHSPVAAQIENWRPAVCFHPWPAFGTR